MATYGAFETIEKIGEGGMGVVYKARDTRLGRLVALKVLRLGLHADPVALERHKREAVAAASLNHPNVATVYEFGDDPSGPFIAMEYVEGVTLRDVLRSGGASREVLLAWASQVADGLAAAHAAGIVHRDVKPENIMIAGDHRAVVLDFGIATRATLGTAAVETRLTVEGGLVGTVQYQAPEVLGGQPAGPGSDVFALGVILYEMATGRVPFDGENTFAILNAILHEEPRPPSAEGCQVGEALDAVILRSLAKDPRQRHRDAAELVSELRRLVGTPSQSIAQLDDVTPGTNLPAPVTRFVGREKELRELERLLGESRLITITGPGGSGKTRLSQELARNRLVAFPGGVWVIELAALNGADEIPEGLAQTLSVRVSADESPLDAVARQVASRETLLLLDNCEHLIDGAAGVASRLLARCPGLRIVATSQERLGAAGETRWQIPPLGIPEDDVADGARCEEFESVQLFRDRATQAKSGFILTPENGPIIARICRRLDGIPLAIELAAARVSVLGPDQILLRLQDRFRLLKSGPRSAEPRQQTLRATVEWSVELLTEAERSLFYRLSVFRGGASLDAVEEVCADGLQDDVLDLLARLVDKSLVITREDREGGLRYDLYQTLRAYGELALGEQRSALAERHARHYVRRASDARPHLTGRDQRAWLLRLADDVANYRAALDHLLEVGDASGALELASSVWRLWFVRGHLHEGRRSLGAVLDALPPGGAPEGEHQGRVAEVHFGAGVLANDQGDFAAADAHFQAGLEIHRGLGDRRGIAQALNSLGVAARDQGRYEAARGLLEQALRIHRDVDDDAGIASSLHALGITEHREGHCATARTLFEEALEIRRRHGDPRGIAALLAHLGSVAYDEGGLAEAESQLGEALAAFEDLGNKRGQVFARIYLGSALLRRGELDRAREHFHACLATSRDLGDQHHLAVSLERFALLRAAEGRGDQAGELRAAADRLRDDIGAPRPVLETAELERDLSATAAPGATNPARSSRAGPLAVARAIKLALGT